MSPIRKRKVFSALEVAKICGVVNQTVINWIRANHLKSSVTPGGQFRVYPDDLRDFLVNKNMRLPEELVQILQEDASVIVVVEDDKILNGMMKAQLSREFPDAEIKQAFDGFEAGSLLAATHPKAVILDMNLPGIDGHEICKRIKGDPEYNKPLVLAISALDDPDLESKVKAEGADAFFKKPVDPLRLAEVIRQKLRW